MTLVELGAEKRQVTRERSVFVQAVSSLERHVRVVKRRVSIDRRNSLPARRVVELT